MNSTATTELLDRLQSPTQYLCYANALHNKIGIVSPLFLSFRKATKSNTGTKSQSKLPGVLVLRASSLQDTGIYATYIVHIYTIFLPLSLTLTRVCCSVSTGYTVPVDLTGHR